MFFSFYFILFYFKVFQNKGITDEQGTNVDIKLYRSMIGSLLYLTARGRTLCFVYVFVLISIVS